MIGVQRLLVFGRVEVEARGIEELIQARTVPQIEVGHDLGAGQCLRAVGSLFSRLGHTGLRHTSHQGQRQESGTERSSGCHEIYLS